MTRKAIRELASVAALALPLLLGASGCHTYKYFDVSYTFDQATFDDSLIKSLHHCRLLVSGADSDNWIIRGCPNPNLPDPHSGGAVEFSSYADSGSMTFEVKAFQGAGIETPDCLVGDGKITLPVTGAMTIMNDQMPLIVTKVGNGCYNVADAGP
jgi:hypothetical protein